MDRGTTRPDGPMLTLLLACQLTENQTAPIYPGEATDPSTASEESPERGGLEECGRVVTTGLDPCGTGETLAVHASGDELAARYDLDGSACITAAGCDQPWASLWVVSGEVPCTMPDGLPLPYRLADDLDHAVCLYARPEGDGLASCYLDTSAGRYLLTLDQPDSL